MSFGESANIYNQGRRPYHKNVINKLSSLINRYSNNIILDLGCGTGIATRQLSRIGLPIIACDIDTDMINTAKVVNVNNVTYHVMATHELSFPTNSIDYATAFCSFHWFCDADSIFEIKRVLKSNGTFFIISRDNNHLKQEILPILQQYCDTSYIFIKEANFIDILNNSGFVDTETYSFTNEEIFTIDELMQLIQTLRFWGYLKQKCKPALLLELNNYFQSQYYSNKYVKQEITKVTIATNRKDL